MVAREARPATAHLADQKRQKAQVMRRAALAVRHHASRTRVEVTGQVPALEAARRRVGAFV
jgi:hypothetical protein